MRTAALLFILVLFGCASHEHRYGAVGEGAKNSGRRSPYEAFFPLEGGSLRLRSEGAVDLREKGGKERFPALHLRVTLANASSPEVWTLDPARQIVLYPDQGQAPAISLNAAPLEVHQGESKSVDLYFKLPAREAELEEFDLNWNVKTGEKTLSETATFARLHERAYDPGYYPYSTFDYGYWGPHYYYRPSIRVRR